MLIFFQHNSQKRRCFLCPQPVKLCTAQYVTQMSVLLLLSGSLAAPGEFPAGWSVFLGHVSRCSVMALILNTVYYGGGLHALRAAWLLM